MKKMTIDEIIADLKALEESFGEETGGSIPLCLSQAVEALEETKMSELEKLKKWLDENGYDARWSQVIKGRDQVVVFENGERSWDAICHSHSYGGEIGLLEVYGSICEDVEGWLRAEDVIRMVERRKKNDPS